MALFPTPLEATFWYEFSELTDTNLWKDSGPYGLHAAPQAGFTAPNYGLAKTSRGKGYATFTGAANCYATLPLRFYDVAPTLDMTLVLAAQHGTQALNGRIVNFRNGAIGWMSYFVTTERMNILSYDAGGVASQTTDAADVPVANRQVVSILSHSKPLLTGYNWHNRVQRTVTPAMNANPIVYDTALVPSLGSAGAGSYFIGQMYFLSLFPFVFTHAQAQAMSDWLRNSGM